MEITKTDFSYRKEINNLMIVNITTNSLIKNVFNFPIFLWMNC